MDEIIINKNMGAELNDTYKEKKVDTLDAKIQIQEAASAGMAAHIGNLEIDLQTAINLFSEDLNAAAIAKSTGLPVKTPSAQYKGFAAEEYYRASLKINAAAKGVANYKYGVFTRGELPDGRTLSGIDMETDISIWTRKNPWSNPVESVRYQSKIHNNPSAYAKDMRNPQYQDVKFVGGSGQGVNDKISMKIAGKTVSSEGITPGDAEDLADHMKAQNVPEYERSTEKFRELHQHTMVMAVEVGAVTGGMFAAVQEIVNLIKNRADISAQMFVSSVKHVLCGTVEGGIRGGAIAGSVVAMGNLMGREVFADSLEAVPAMAAANVAVDLGKDLYKCFVTGSIDVDDLLCHTVTNVFCSVTGYLGSWEARNLTAAALTALDNVKNSAAAGATIASPLGPIGACVGSVVGAVVIGFCAKLISNTAVKDAYKAYNECVAQINKKMKAGGFEYLYYFADSMSTLSEIKLSFKDLLPCYNLISDLEEFNIHKKALKQIEAQLDDSSIQLDANRKFLLHEISARHERRLAQLRKTVREQKNLMQHDFKESITTYISNSYFQYLKVYAIIQKQNTDLLEAMTQQSREYNSVLDGINCRNQANEALNITLSELMKDPDGKELLSPFLSKVIEFMKQDSLLIGKQYLSKDDALKLIGGVK